MKSICSFLVILAALALFSGCSITSREKQVLEIPTGAIVIENRTPYFLRLMRNNELWVVLHHRGKNTPMMFAPVKIIPRGIIIAFPDSVYPNTDIYLQIVAIEEQRVGCLITRRIMGSYLHRFVFNTNEPPARIVVRVGDIKRS